MKLPDIIIQYFKNLKFKNMKQQLVITSEEALKMDPTASSDLKTILEQSFTKEFFNRKITDRIKTFEDACVEIGITSEQFLKDYCSKTDTSDEIAYKKLKIIAKALNEGWESDFTNGKWDKWTVYLYWDEKKSAFVYSSTVNWVAYASVGARLCFSSKEKAEHAVKHFSDLFIEFLTIKK